MPKARVLLTALLTASTALLTADAKAQDATPEAEAIEHIEKLEQLLRDAGLEPPERPDALLEEATNSIKLVVPNDVEAGPFKKQVKAINQRSKDAVAALRHIRNGMGHDDPARAKAAEDIIFAIYDWAQAQAENAAALAKTDPVAAYIAADDALELVGRDPIGQLLQRYLKTLRAEQDDWRGIRSQAAFRRAMQQAEAVGLTGDWSLVDFGNSRVRDEIKQITQSLRLITNAWPGSTGDTLAAKTLREWQRREAQAIANEPAWRYTYNLGLIWVGTERETSITTLPTGEIIIEEEERPTYDRKRVQLFGTFQNTSDKPYRYSFNVGVSTQFKLGLPFPGSSPVAGLAQVNTPVLSPGEVYNWSTEVSVRNASDIRQVGLGGVQAHVASIQQAQE